MTNYTVRFENTESGTTWTFNVVDGAWTDAEAFANFLEDSDAVDTVIDIVEEITGEDYPDVTINDSRMTIASHSFDDDAWEEIAGSVKTYLEDLGAEVTDLDKD